MSGVLVNAAIEYRKTYDAIAESCYDGGEMTDEASAELVQLESNIQKHAVGYVSIIKQLEADAMACEHEARILNERANRLKQSAKWLEDRIKQAMELVGAKKLQYATVTLSIQANGGKRSVKIDDTRVTADYIYTYTEKRVDKDKIRDELEAGKQLPFATLLERGTHLRISGKKKAGGQ